MWFVSLSCWPKLLSCVAFWALIRGVGDAIVSDGNSCSWVKRLDYKKGFVAVRPAKTLKQNQRNGVMGKQSKEFIQ